MQDQAGLDGFAQAHLVRQQHPRSVTRADLVGNVKLMGNQVDAAADESAHWRLAAMMLMLERPVAQLKICRLVGSARSTNDLPADQN